jgi:hypothetical protein
VKIHNNISGHKHVDLHLHLKKDFSISSIKNRIKSDPPRKSALNATDEDFIFVKISDIDIHGYQKIKPLKIFSKVFSGLSPPVS